MSTTTILRKSPLLRTVEGEQLLALARTIKVGEVLTYERVRAELSVDMQSPAGRQLWHKAQAVLADEDSVQFACNTGVGYRRLADGEKVAKSGRYIGQATKRVRAAGRVLTTVDRNALTATERVAHDVQSTVVGLMQAVARPAIAVSRTKAPSQDDIDAMVGALGQLSARRSP